MTVIDPEIMNILCCPESHQKLREAPTPVIEQLNRQIAQGLVRNRGGAVVAQSIMAGLIRQDGKFLYPVREQPVLLVDEAIPLP